MGSITLDAVHEALTQVQDPIFNKSLHSLGTILEVRLDKDRVWTKLRISSPSEEIRTILKSRVDEALKPLGVEFIEIEWDVQIPTRETTSEDPIAEVRNVILVMSGKGGVGKSTVSTNLSLALRRLGTRVGMLDADIYGPSLPTMLGIQGHPVSKDGHKIQPLQKFGLKLMSIGFLLEDPKQAVVWRGPMLHGALQQFIADVDWGSLDYLILDLPPGTGDVALTLAQKVQLTGALIVTTPQEVALQDVYKSVSMCKKLNIPILGVIENMSYFVDSAGVTHELFGSGGGVKIAEFADAPLLGQIPLDPQVREWGDQGTPVVQAAPTSPPGQAFSEIADTLTERIAKEHFEQQGGNRAPKGENQKRLRILR